LPLAGWFFGRWAIGQWHGLHHRRAFHPAWIWAGFAISILFGILRNLPIGRAWGLAP
jgi:hypothetical protein